MAILSQGFIEWLDSHANALDQSNQYADQLFERLATEGVFGIGVPIELGGQGGTLWQAVEIIQEIATHSLTAAFVTWGHRTLIQNLVQSTNPFPRQQWLPALLKGDLSGGTGLSNAVKYLSGIEALQVNRVEKAGKTYLQGRLPWITNLTEKGFVTVLVAGDAQGSKPPVIVALPHFAAGVSRSDTLPLVALQGSNTVAVSLNEVELDPRWILAEQADTYLAQVRPAFLGLQCAMAFGLSERALAEVAQSLGGSRSILTSEWQTQKARLTELREQLKTGLHDGKTFIAQPKALFQIRITVVDVVVQSLLLELQASGGRGYLQHAGGDFIRRWREGAFLPVVTPSALQLKTILQAV